MKKYNNILLTGCLSTALLLSSCDKFLDKPLENQQRSQEINYSNSQLMYSPVSGVYRAASDDNLVHWIDLCIRAIRDDDFLQAAPTPNDQPELMAIKGFQNDVTIQSYWGLNQSWISYYSLAISANNALIELENFAQHIDANNAELQALNKQYQAEVRFLRAYAHLMASRIFGDVPILSDSGDIARLTTITKSTRAEVRQWIIEEMDFCVANLKKIRPNESAPYKGAVTAYSALLLKAKAAADLAGNDNGSPQWDVVIDATNEIINSNRFSLYGDFYELWKLKGKLSNESLFELQYSDFGLPTGDIVRPGVDWGTFFKWQGPTGNQRGTAISGSGWIPPSQNIVDFLTARGDAIRLKTTILQYGPTVDEFTVTPSGDKVYGNAFGIKYFNGKAYLPANQMTEGRLEYGANNNVRILRYADVLLLNAEAKVRKGQNGDAPFALVRDRVNMGAITGVTLDQILDERRAEFACEWWGERFNDLVRTGKATQVYGSKFVPGVSESVPIPQTQIDANSNFR